MAVNLTGVLSDLSSAIPSSSDILQQVLLGAGATVVLSGLKTSAGMDAVDPLHLIPRPATATTPRQYFDSRRQEHYVGGVQFARCQRSGASPRRGLRCCRLMK